MKQLTLGDPLNESTEVGPISNARQYRHVMNLIDNATSSEGGRAIAGIIPKGEGLFVVLTILADLEPASTAASQEIFGPVVTSLQFENVYKNAPYWLY